MASTIRFDKWEDSEGNPVLDGTGLAIPSSALPTGTILQVVQTTLTSVFTSASTSFTDVTGLTATITPSSTTSKILVIAQLTIGSNTTTEQSVLWRLNGGNSSTFIGDASGSNSVRGVGSILNSTGNIRTDTLAIQSTMVYLDSPATTSATTYAVQVRTSGAGTLYVNRPSINADDVKYINGASSITVMEVAA